MLAVGSSRELQAAVLAVKAADRDLRNLISRQTRVVLNPVWREETAQALSAASGLERRVLGSGVRVKAGNPPAVVAASSRRGLGRTRRLTPDTAWQLWEFGAYRGHKATYSRQNASSGGTHQVTRRTNTGLPNRNRGGRFIFPAVGKTIPRMTALWVQTIVRSYSESLGGKN